MYFSSSASAHTWKSHARTWQPSSLNASSKDYAAWTRQNTPQSCFSTTTHGRRSSSRTGKDESKRRTREFQRAIPWWSIFKFILSTPQMLQLDSPLWERGAGGIRGICKSNGRIALCARLGKKWERRACPLSWLCLHFLLNPSHTRLSVFETY